uniref:Retrotransposon protein, putative, unclassified n=1 Tax=Oryza sativa subsp. japonica TaxID=39947 RepID=Q2QWR1_ORYSJ|nr:retrotransposon protein, putative, unclassified [Oryza sativa Japonica Group]
MPIDPEKFTPEQKAEFEATLQQAQNQFLNSFMQTRKGTLVQKYKIKVVADSSGTGSSKDGEVKQALGGSAQLSTKGATDGSPSNEGDSSQGVHDIQGDGAQEPQGGSLNQNSELAQDFFNNFQDRVDYAVHHALINQSGVLVDTLTNMIKTIADGSIAEHQAAGPVYLQGGVFPNYRSLITDVQPSVQAIPSVAPTTQPMAPVSTPLPATLAMTPGQPVNPRLLTRDQPQHGGQAANRLTQDQVAAMFLPPPPIVDPVQQQPVQQTPPIQPVVQPIQQQVVQPAQQIPTRQQPLQPIQQTPPRQQLQQPIHQTSLRQQIVQPIQHQGSVNASAGFAAPGGQPVQQFVNQVVLEHLVHHAQPDGTVMPQMVPEHLPYPEWFERVPLPNRFKVPDFSKFSGKEGVSTYEHISRFPAQCGEALAVDALRVRLLRLSLSGSAFTWFSSLPYGSINSWADLEKQFHSYFYSGVHEMKLTDLTVIKQRHDEPVHEYIQRFREMRNKCFSLSLTDAQLADLAFQGMIPPIREKFSSKDFDSLSYLIQKVTLHEHRSAEVRKSSKKVNHVCPYMYGSDDKEDDSEIAATEWVRSKKVIPCQWVKSPGKEKKYDFDITKAYKIFDLLLREKQIQLPTGHTIPSAEELGKKRYCKWHNSGSHSTNDCKVFRQQIQFAIERGKIRFDDSKKPMKVDGNPFPVNMVHTAGQAADKACAKGFQVNSAKIINKYQKKYDKQQERHYEEYDDGFDPHWGCEFFRFCWNEGMRLPSIENCPGCSDVVESSSRSYSRGNRLRQARLPVHQRLGPMNQDRGQEDEAIRKNQWCPFGIFTKNQKRTVQRLRSRERFQEVEEEINHRLRKPKPRREWRVKNQVPVADDAAADEVKRLAKGKSVIAAPINMVLTLPAEFGIDQADVDEVEEGLAKLVLSTEQAVFEKPEGTENRHLKPLYINGYVNGKPMSEMMVDGGAAVNLMPYATFRKLGRNAEDLIKTNMVLKDFGGNPSETKGVLNVELTVGRFLQLVAWTGLDPRQLLHPFDYASMLDSMARRQDRDRASRQVEDPSYYFEGVVEGSNVYAKDTVDDLDDKQGQGFMSADELEEIDIGPGDRPRPTFISKKLSPEFRTKLIELLKEFRDCFAWEYYEMPGLSRSIVEHWLPIKPGVRPRQQPPKRCKADTLEPVKAEIKRLYDAGFIHPCRYAEWVSSIVPVIKKNGKVRVCIDFRDLNKATPKDEYPMPVADQLADAPSGNKILSFMDGNAVMTFGLKSAGATYQRAMNYIYQDLIGWLVEVYIDDVVVKSKEVEDHIADLRKVFERTRKYGLKMNPTKCAFGVLAGQFFGFLVHERGIEVTQRSVNAIKKIQPPENKTELQEMIGKINFVRRFISNLSGRLRHYLLSNECTVICKADVVRYMLSAPILKGRVGKWIFSLTEFDLRYESPKAIKGQAIADFIVEHHDDSIGLVEIVPWTLFFDGSVCTNGCGIGLVIISARGACFEFAYTIKPYATNNQAEYEAVLKGLQLLKEVEADTIEIMGDSLLVISQLAGEYECKNDTLMVYNEKCLELMKEFRLVTLKHVSREQNLEANDLAQGASGYKPMIKDVKVEIATMSADDWRYDVHQYLNNPSQSASRKLRYKALKYTLLDDELYYRAIDGVLLKCLSADQAKVAIGEVHEGICGTHQSAHKMKWLLWRAGGWGIDMIGMINPPSSKGHKFILVVTDYFTKWVEAIPLKKVDSGDAIQFVQEHIIYRFGLPQTITTDQGSIFVSDEFVQFADSVGIKLLNSSPYYAQANGQAEASNKSLIKLIKRKISDYPRQWHTWLDETLWSYWMACHGSIQVPPYKLVYGNEAVLPWEVRISSRRTELQNDLTADEYYNLMADEREDLVQSRLRALA